MTAINVSENTKREFDDLQKESMTQDEFMQELLAAYRRDNGEIVNPEEIAQEIDHKVASKVEEAAYRGIQDALGEL